MQDNDKNIKEILAYLGNEMPKEDRYAFERKMEADPFLMDAVEGYEGMDANQIQEELEELQSRLSSKNTKRLVPIWLRAAASIALIIGIGSLLLLTKKADETGLVSDNIKPTKKESSIEKVPSVIQSPKLVEMKPEVPTQKNEIEEPEEVVDVQFKEKPRKDFLKRSAKKATVAQEVKKQEVNMSLRYEEDAVKAERELVGKMAGVDIGEVEGSGGLQDMVIQARTSSYKDTLIANYRGRVVDEAGIPLPGVQVRNTNVEDESSNGQIANSTVTDPDGNFEIKAPEKGTVLELSTIGFKDQLASAERDSMGELVMEEEVLAMDEVVAIGYGSAKRKKMYSASTKGLDLGDLNLNEAVPVEGIKKMIRRIEKELVYPKLSIEDKKEVVADVFVLSSGEVDKVVYPYQKIDLKFKEILTTQIKQAKWQAPLIEGAPVNSYKRIEFEFKTE